MNILRACFEELVTNTYVFNERKWEKERKREQRKQRAGKEEGERQGGKKGGLGNWATSHLNVMASDHHLMEFWYHLKDAAFNLIRTTFYAGKSTGLSLTQFRVLFLSKGALTSNPL